MTRADQDRASRTRGIGLGMLLTALLVVFTVSLSIVAPPSPNPDHHFDTQAAADRLGRILGDERPHPVDTDANDAVRERLLTEIRTLGFDPIVRDDFLCSDRFGVTCARVRNVLFWAVPPTDETTLGVALMSHYDSVPAGPGASDDGAGVTVGLEVARILSDRAETDRPRRPVLILITDGEEIGLMGAESFVRSDPLAPRIGAVVNVEARGVRGPASMFQTSTPNAQDLVALAKGGRTALANSLATDIYEAMPNDTDLSVFLDPNASRRVDATNYAFILGDSFYHTPGDTLANLDRGSLFHIGINALESVERFADSPKQASSEGETERLYFDLLTRGVLSVPAWVGPVILALCGLLSLTVLLRQGGWRGWRGWAGLPLALLGGGLMAVGLSLALGAMKTSGAYSPAYPWALRGLQAGGAMMGALLVCAALSLSQSGKDRVHRLLKSWVLLSVLGLVGWWVFPGSAIVFLGASVLGLMAAVSALAGKPHLAIGLSLVGVVVFILVNLALPGFALAALGSLAAPLAALWTLPVILIVASTHTGLRPAVVAIGGVTAALALMVLILPTYTAQAPQAVSIQHFGSDGGSVLALSGPSEAPTPMNLSSEFSTGIVPGSDDRMFGSQRPIRASETAPDIDVTTTILSDLTDNESRTVTLNIQSPDADQLYLVPASKDTVWASASVNGIAVQPNRWGIQVIGRSARDVTLDIVLPKGETLGKLAVTRYGLSPEARRVAETRPDWTIPRHDGDVQVRLIDLD